MAAQAVAGRAAGLGGGLAKVPLAVQVVGHEDDVVEQRGHGGDGEAAEVVVGGGGGDGDGLVGEELAHRLEEGEVIRTVRGACTGLVGCPGVFPIEVHSVQPEAVHDGRDILRELEPVCVGVGGPKDGRRVGVGREGPATKGQDLLVARLLDEEQELRCCRSGGQLDGQVATNAGERKVHVRIARGDLVRRHGQAGAVEIESLIIPNLDELGGWVRRSGDSGATVGDTAGRPGRSCRGLGHRAVFRGDTALAPDVALYTGR